MEFKIRPVRSSDAQDLQEIRTMRGVVENCLAYPSQRVAQSEENIAKLGDDSHYFVAVVTLPDGSEKVVANAGLHVETNPRLRHTAEVGILVHTDYQGMGIGKALMNSLLDMADNWLMLVRVDLEVYTDNERAIHLYESLGFVKEGILRKAAIRNGQYVDAFIMARIKE